VAENASPFRTWNGVEPYSLFQGATLHAIGGDQVLLCKVSYDPGTRVPRHAHKECEQVMAIVDGGVTMTIEGETRYLGPGDVVVVSRGLQHELHSESGCTFFEALSPVPRDHVPDPGRDLVLGPEGGSAHVEK
jgi:quercetin dioxygenase-like cupin family protein